jgi:septal ring factor EnvC (AmiA/AmiB activator)
MADFFKKIGQKIETTLNSPEKEKNDKPAPETPEKSDNTEAEKKTRINLQSASREDLVAFIRKQNEHVKKLEALNKAAKAKQEVDFKSEADELRLQIAQQKKDFAMMLEEREGAQKGLEELIRTQSQDLQKLTSEYESIKEKLQQADSSSAKNIENSGDIQADNSKLEELQKTKKSEPKKSSKHNYQPVNNKSNL